MSIMLYTHGDSAIIRGVLCDYTLVHAGQLKDYLAKGYVTDPKELEKPTEPVEEEKQQPDEPTLAERFINTPESMSLDELVMLGAKYGLKLHRRTKPENMVKKIREAIQNE